MPDPTSSQGLNRYSYGSNNPVSNVDPSGHDPDVPTENQEQISFSRVETPNGTVFVADNPIVITAEPPSGPETSPGEGPESGARALDSSRSQTTVDDNSRRSPLERALLNRARQIDSNADVSCGGDLCKVFNRPSGRILAEVTRDVPGGTSDLIQPGDFAGGFLASRLAPVAGRVATTGQKAAEEGGAIAKRIPEVIANRSNGKLWEDVIANGLRDQLKNLGLRVRPQVFFRTPLGGRFIDIVVDDPVTGRIIGMVEAKAGTSSYLLAQRLKDVYLMRKFGVPIFVERIPWSKPWF